MKHTLIISPFKGCNLEIKGVYSKAEPDVNYPETFEIDTIENYEKDITQLLIWCEGRDILAELEELCLDQIRNYEPDYEKE